MAFPQVNQTVSLLNVTDMSGSGGMYPNLVLGPGFKVTPSANQRRNVLNIDPSTFPPGTAGPAGASGSLGPSGSMGPTGPSGSIGPPGSSALTTSGFTQPATGSNVTVNVTSASLFQPGYAASIPLSGTTNFYTVVTGSGNTLTLFNGLVTNLAQGTFFQTGLGITVASSPAPIQNVVVKPGQSLVLQPAANSYKSQGIRTTENVLSFAGVDPTGATDSWAGIQAAINFCTTNGHELFFPPGTYKISRTLIVDTSVGFAFHMQGTGGNQFPFTSVLTYTGVAGQPMVSGSGVGQGGFECNDLDFNMNGLAYTSWQLPAHFGIQTDDWHWNRCGFSSPWQHNYWVPSASYSPGDTVVGPDSGVLVSNQGNRTNNGYVYQCVTGGISNSPGPAGSWGNFLNSGSIVVDGTVTWVQIGRTGCGFALGSDGPGVDGEVSEIKLTDCFFVGGGANSSAAGFLQLVGGNMKNVILDKCQFLNCGRAIDVSRGSGIVTIDSPIFADSAECDVFGGSCSVIVNNAESEGSNRFICGGGQNATMTVNGGEWSGNPEAYGSSPSSFGANFFPVIYNGSMQWNGVQIDAASLLGSGTIGNGSHTFNLTSFARNSPGFFPNDVGKSVSIAATGGNVGFATTIAAYVSNTQVTLTDPAPQLITTSSILMTNAPFVAVQNIVQSAGNSASAFSSDGCIYQGAQFFPVIDANGVPVCGLGGSIAGLSTPQYRTTQTRVSSNNDVGTLNNGITVVNFHAFVGNNLAIGTQQPLNNLTQGLSVGVVPSYNATLGGVYKATVPFTAAINAAQTQTFNVCGLFGVSRITRVYANVTQGFSGSLAAVSASVGRLTSISGGSQLTASFLLPQSVTASSTTYYLGSNQADLGSDLTTGLVQGAFFLPTIVSNNPPQTPGGQWAVTCTVSGSSNLGNGTATNLTAGSIDVYVEFGIYPFFGNGQTLVG